MGAGAGAAPAQMIEPTLPACIAAGCVYGSLHEYYRPDQVKDVHDEMYVLTLSLFSLGSIQIIHTCI